jgi:hypothetical protein
VAALSAVVGSGEYYLSRPRAGLDAPSRKKRSNIGGIFPVLLANSRANTWLKCDSLFQNETSHG